MDWAISGSTKQVASARNRIAAANRAEADCGDFEGADGGGGAAAPDDGRATGRDQQAARGVAAPRVQRGVVGRASCLPVTAASSRELPSSRIPISKTAGRDARTTGRLEACPTILATRDVF